jgi:PAS domain S-box-containing protein
MKLLGKTLIVIGLSTACFLIALYAASEGIMLDSYARLEEQDMHRNIQRVIDALESDVQTMDSVSADWSAWDDTYAFVQDANRQYVESNLASVDSFLNNRVNFMIFVNNSGSIVFEKTVDLATGEEQPLPSFFRNRTDASDIVMRHYDAENKTTGIIILPEGPTIIASHPILKTDKKGPVMGTLIWGRYLDSGETARLSNITHLPVSFIAFDDPAMTFEVAAAGLELSGNNPLLVQPVNDSVVAGYALVTDVYGKPVLILRTEQQRSIYMQGRTSIQYFILLLMVFSILFAVVTTFLLERLVLSKIARLSSTVNAIGASGDLSKRVPASGSDELSNLGRNVNSMFAALESAQEKLEESEREFHDLFENAADPALILDRDGNVLDANVKLVELLGHTIEEIKEPGFVRRKLYTQESTTTAFENLEKRFKGVHVPLYEVEVIRKDGTTLPVEINARLTTFKGQPADLISLRDITERKKVEHMKEDFFASVTHELKTPVTSMVSLTDSLYGKKAGDINKQQKEILGYIKQDGVRLRQIVDRILTFSKIELGMGLNRQDVDLEELIDKAVNVFTPSAMEKRIELSKNVPSPLPNVSCDMERITDVLNNLIGNAIKFTPENGSVKVKAVASDGEVTISVSDTGIGIHPEDRKKIGTKYYQVSPEKTGVVGGSGLGLYVCRRIAEQHGGRFWFESTPGAGSSFYVTLPIGVIEDGEKKRNHSG